MRLRPQVVVGVSAIIVSKGRILLLRRSVRAPEYAGRWDLPGGMVERGETLETALRREVRAETGLAVRIHWTVDARIVYASPSRGGIAVTFQCSLKGRRTPRVAPIEHDAFQWIAPRLALRLKPRPPQRQAIRVFLAGPTRGLPRGG